MIDRDFLRGVTGDYEVVAKSATDKKDTPPPVDVVTSVEKNADGTEVMKALVVSNAGTEVQSASNARPSVEAEQNFFLGAGALIPRYDPWAMARVWENSSALRPCIDAYKSNIDGFGFRLDPVIDPDKENAKDMVRSALLQERLYEGSADPVDDDHVAAALETMKIEMQREKFKLERFFSYCCPTLSFVQLRMQTRIELESIGNAYWEVIRDGAGNIQQFERVDSVTMRLRPIHIEHVLVDTPQKISPLKYKDVPVPRRFRTFVQLVNGLIAVYFKEFGDDRVLSAKTGNFYESVKQLKEKEGDLAVEATEILWWSIFTPIGPYGIPRWVGATMNVLGLRASEEINFSYFDQKCIPPMAVLVSGGSLKAGAVDAIKAHFKEQIQGRENFWSVLVIEAESQPGQAMSSNARCRIELKPLTEAQLKDALFQEYEKNGAGKIGAQFRLPELLRGVSQEVNRAQAMAVLQFAEQQVFEVERQEFDNIMNRRVLADMGIRYWTFRTNSAPASDPEQLTNLTSTLATAGALTVNETRALASEALNKEFKKIEDKWGDVPFQLTLQGVISPDGSIPSQQGAPGAPGAPPGPGADAGAPPGADGAPPPGPKAPPGAKAPGPKTPAGPPAAGGSSPSPQAAPDSGDQASSPDADALSSDIAAANADIFGDASTAKRLVLRVPVAKMLEWIEPDAAE